MEKKSNPNGANQYQADPRQALFLKYYLDPKSETFSNAYQSAIKAKYSEDYAKIILSEDLQWLSENLRTEKMLKRAEKNLDAALEQEYKVPKKYGEEIVYEVNPQVMKVVVDTSKFVAERLGKKKWSERKEHTGADGEKLIPIYGGISRHAGDAKDIQPHEEDTGGSGRDVSEQDGEHIGVVH